MLYANYALVDATFQSSFIVASPNNPSSAAFNCLDGPPGPPLDPDEPICVQVNAGDTIPGIPLNRFKAGFDFLITPQWKLGADLVAASSQVFFGDEGNDNPPLPGYAKVDLHTFYDVTENVQLYGLVQPVHRSTAFGNFFPSRRQIAPRWPICDRRRHHEPRTIAPAVCRLRRRQISSRRRRGAPCHPG
jgi:hypothetical protein